MSLKKNTITDTFSFIRNNFGKLDVLINNAAANYDIWQDTTTADLQEVKETLETNFFGPCQIIQIMLPLLKLSDAARI